MFHVAFNDKKKITYETRSERWNIRGDMKAAFIMTAAVEHARRRLHGSRLRRLNTGNY